MERNERTVEAILKAIQQAQAQGRHDVMRRLQVILAKVRASAAVRKAIPDNCVGCDLCAPPRR